ncbi:MAG: DUF5107 domain-containing protein [Victivallales bacterium]|nr:DUF5107 domain-containing protein [Victivallales bacterium]
MSTLTVIKKKLTGPRLGADSAIPVVTTYKNLPYRVETAETDELYVGYHVVRDSLPYTMQEEYDTPETELEFNAVVLENQYIRATIVPDLGGKLWSLYDKEAKRDIFYNNPKFLPNNLAVRNAWTAGGAEYNIGRFGHDEQTCSRRFAATLQDTDGTPVLRIYEFARDPAIPFQIDFYLPENSRQLLARVRIFNANNYVVPLYWWTNIAVPEVPECRVILPAKDAFVNKYDQATTHYIVAKENLGTDAEIGFDGTFPARNRNAKDYFFNIPREQKKFETIVYPDGYGVLFASTSRLQGRKLFVWGQGEGAKNWQLKLAPAELGGYVEIQGGVCKSQWEYMPMPAKTAWEWIEAYGAFSADPEKCYGNWDDAVEYVSGAVAECISHDFLEAELKRTRESFACKPGKVIFTGSEWGALEEKRRGEAMTAHLDFGTVSEKMADWTSLLENGTMPEGDVNAVLVQQEWREKLLACTAPNWKVNYFLGLMAIHGNQLDKAEEYIRKSLEQNENAWNLMAMAAVYADTQREEQTLEIYEKLIQLRPFDVALVKNCLRNGVRLNMEPQKIIDAQKILSEEVLQRPYVKLCIATALFKTGRIDEAEAIIMENGGLEVPDAREGETSITELYINIQIKRAELQGKTLTAKEVKVPRKLDLRMSEQK